jgi:hypothetical protein
MKATVTQETKVVKEIWVLEESSNSVIIGILTEETYPKVLSFNSAYLHLQGCTIKFEELPFQDRQIFFMPDRNMLLICIFRDELIALITSTPEKCIFETPS